MSDKTGSGQQRDMLGRALEAIESLESRLAAVEHERTEPIAIVGMACRFPGAASLDEYWQVLADGRCTVSEVPADRWDKAAFLDPDPSAPGKMHAAFGGFLERMDLFDAAFFGIAGREAETMDPQQRMLLELAWNALEHAGIAPESLRGSQTGVFVGITTTDYARLAVSADTANFDVYTATGGALNVAAGRLSYVLGLNGPAMAIDTACSSSLVALHLACQSLRSRECAAAIVGGVNALLTPEPFVCFAKWGMMAPDGRCKTFDEQADGFVRSEGCGVLVLKRLGDALAAGDRVLAVVRGTAVNQDGASSGLTVPNGLAQQAVVRSALHAAGVAPADVDYVEAHGTGTTLGDPIELEALVEVLGEGRSAARPLLVGSVKTNIGHAESASGVAGLIKVVLAMRHGSIPAHLHFTRMNPRISLQGVPVRVPTAPTPWPATARPGIAGVSSFGFSGTNAHAVIEAYPQAAVPRPASSEAARSELLVLSAKTRTALDALAQAYAARLRQPSPPALRDLCHTAAVGRAALRERLAVVAADATDLARALDAVVREGRAADAALGSVNVPPKIAFLFTGQGAQYYGMGRELYRTERVFRDTFDRCAVIADVELEQPLARVVGYGTEVLGDAERLDDTRYAQPALFAIEFALAELWRSWGIVPAAVAGHSLGEYVAAVVAGVLTLEAAMKLVIARARLMSSLPRDGAMVVLFTDEARARAAIGAYAASVAIAAVNGPQNVVISGRAEHVRTIAETLRAAGVDSRPLAVSHAFHSPLVDPMLDEFETIAAVATPQASSVRFVSNLTGRAVADATTLDARYWRRHAREAVRFADAVRSLYDDGVRAFLEIGPATVLLGMARQTLMAEDVLWLPSLRKEQDSRRSLLASIGALFVAGVAADWSALGGADAQRVDAPSYPFQRKRFWLPTASPAVLRPPAVGVALPHDGHPLLGQRIASPQRDVLFDGPFALAACPPLLEHRIGGVPIVPAAAYIEAANAAAVVLGSGAHVIANGWLRAPLLLDPATPRRTQLVVARSADGAATFEVFSRAADDESAPWTSHAGGRFASAALAVDRPDLAVVRERCKRGVDVVAYRREMTDVGLDYGPSFHSLVAAWGGRREAFGELRLPHDDGIAARVMAHPGMLDAAFHLIGVAFEKQDDEQRFFLPTGYEAAELSRRLGTAAFAYVALRDSDAARLVADIWLWQADGTPAGCVLGLAARATSKEQFTSAMARRSGALHLAWPAARDAAQVPAGGVWRVLGGSVELRAAVDQELRARGAHVELCDGAAGVLRAPKAGATALGVVDLRPSTRAQSGAQLPTQTVADGPVAATTELLRTAAGGEAPPGSRLLVVTRATQRVSADETVDACGATLWGIVATAAAEIQGVDVRLLDLEADGASADDAAAIAAAALRADDETRLARRGREFHAPRLTPAGAPDSLEVPARAYTLAMRNRGSLDGLAIEPLERVTPGPRQVEIEVLASGLNFRDVLNLLDMYPGPAGPLGNECCGRIVAVGSEVTELAVGDLVMCIAESTFGSHVIAEATLTFRVPAKLSLAQAAAFPIAQLTAYLALYRVGGIRRGDRVLIHAGAGGVGLAAVHLALAAGAEVLASAGSEEKRDYLRRLGVRHVFDSRRVPDAAAVRAATEGHGVDLLLNSLTGEFIDAGIDALATGGRFLEIGLRELRTPEQVRARRDDIAYHALLLGDWCRNDPAAVRAMYDALVAALDAGRIPPPAVRAFPLADAPRAFRFMAQARHIGRIALTHRAVGTAGVRADARYVITGGLGAIGLHVARWLVERGARYVVLAARSAPNDAAARAVAELRARGATIELVRGDVADPAAVSLGTQGAPVRGIFHAAGVVDDVILARLDTARLLRVLRPKADGLHNLLRATTDDLDMLVLFSSGSAVLGSPGQAAYAGANAFLDGSAHALRAAGRVATSVNWGAWAESGMAARVDERTAREWQARGIGMLTPDAGLRELEAAIGSGAAQTVALAIDWPKFLGALERRPTLLEELGPQRSPEPSAAAGPSLRIVLEQLSPKQRLEHLTRCMVDETAAVLGVGADDIVVRSGLTEQGMDSLMAVELANRLGRLAGVSLPSTFAFDHPTLAALAEHLLAQVLPPEAGSTGAARSSPKSVATGGDLSTGDLGALSATELEEELRRELDRAGF